MTYPVARRSSLGLSLNVVKYSFMAFTRLSCPIPYTHHIDNIPIEQHPNDVVRNLGFLLFKDISPVAHVQEKFRKALTLLAITHFTTKNPLLSLFST